MRPALAVPLFVAAAALAAIGQFMVLRDALRGRTPAASVTRAGQWREGLWIVLPAVALALTLWATWRALPPRPLSSVRGTGPIAFVAPLTAAGAR